MDDLMHKTSQSLEKYISYKNGKKALEEINTTHPSIFYLKYSVRFVKFKYNVFHHLHYLFFLLLYYTVSISITVYAHFEDFYIIEVYFFIRYFIPILDVWIAKNEHYNHEIGLSVIFAIANSTLLTSMYPNKYVCWCLLFYSFMEFFNTINFFTTFGKKYALFIKGLRNKDHAYIENLEKLKRYAISQDPNLMAKKLHCNPSEADIIYRIDNLYNIDDLYV